MVPDSNSPPTIERAAPSDLETVADRWVALARDQRRHDSAVLADANREAMRQTLAAHQANDGLLVARDAGRIVGFASFHLEHGSLALDTTRGMLSNIYVEPAYRGQGLGGALLEAAEAELEERGAEAVVLEVMADNEAARRFYDRQGYDAYRVSMERDLEGEDGQDDERDHDP
ncbi:GNAT family N-acetyltransferase [Natronolimnohabitans innermongolicus]|uniref:N-acetyltransferase GCN5 n=1 Tax=Natronolimnohabitans innermongolicus JCM 12255 TaxID=1227499 RepID=L9XMH7_9EURY|nr:GNAT family N-acetyltransferase [Natronolimnohabitans innermongolicus]ELY61868.1 N-acetyltransferase GCN5 [Natronolimnohabitans innermongolicus JCM 12255]